MLIDISVALQGVGIARALKREASKVTVAVVVWSIQRDGEGGPTGGAVVGAMTELYQRLEGLRLAGLDARVD